MTKNKSHAQTPAAKTSGGSLDIWNVLPKVATNVKELVLQAKLISRLNLF